tara:strand:+ start:267 stop:461 length:195 start_codon:yes stop_codon:yes gene_type:complete
MENKSIFRINQELDWKRNEVVADIKRQCKSKYPKDENKKDRKIKKILRFYEDYIFELSKLKIEE